MAESDLSSSSINDTITVNVGTLSNAIAAAIQQSRTESSANGSDLLNVIIAEAIALDRVPTFTVTVSLIEDDDGSESAITEHCTPLSGDDNCAHASIEEISKKHNKKRIIIIYTYLRTSRFKFIPL